MIVVAISGSTCVQRRSDNLQRSTSCLAISTQNKFYSIGLNDANINKIGQVCMLSKCFLIVGARLCVITCMWYAFNSVDL